MRRYKGNGEGEEGEINLMDQGGGVEWRRGEYGRVRLWRWGEGGRREREGWGRDAGEGRGREERENWIAGIWGLGRGREGWVGGDIVVVSLVIGNYYYDDSVMQGREE